MKRISDIVEIVEFRARSELLDVVVGIERCKRFCIHNIGEFETAVLFLRFEREIAPIGFGFEAIGVARGCFGVGRFGCDALCFVCVENMRNRVVSGAGIKRRRFRNEFDDRVIVECIDVSIKRIARLLAFGDIDLQSVPILNRFVVSPSLFAVDLVEFFEISVPFDVRFVGFERYFLTVEHNMRRFGDLRGFAGRLRKARYRYVAFVGDGASAQRLIIPCIFADGRCFSFKSRREILI